MLSGKNIWKSYDELSVLKGVDLEISDSNIVSIVGKSGAGKSTLLHILGTLDLPDKGEVIIDGTSITSLSAKALAAFRNEKIGFVFQFHHLIPEFTALESAKSIIRVLPPKYTAGFALISVSSLRRLPRPPANTKAIVSRASICVEMDMSSSPFSIGIVVAPNRHSIVTCNLAPNDSFDRIGQ